MRVKLLLWFLRMLKGKPNMRQVLVTVGSRANYGRLISLIDKLRGNSAIDTKILAHSSALVDRFGGGHNLFAQNGHHVDYMIYNQLVGDNSNQLTKTISLAAQEISNIFQNNRPDIVIVGGDRYEILAVGIACLMHNIKLVHLQGGEISGNVDDKIRDIMSTCASVHCVVNEAAMENLQARLGSNANIHVTGCPGNDLSVEIKKSSIKPNFLYLPENGVGRTLDPDQKKFALVVIHPESYDHDFNSSVVDCALSAITNSNVVKNVVALWPNSDLFGETIARRYREILEHNEYKDLNIRMFKGFYPREYLLLLKECFFAVGNSSSFVREGSLLSTPSLLIGDRQVGRDIAANAQVVKKDKIEDSIRSLQHSRLNDQQQMKYGDGSASEKIVNIIESL